MLNDDIGAAVESPAGLRGVIGNRLGRAVACGAQLVSIDALRYQVARHRLRPALEEFLYPAMEDWRVDVRIAEGPHAETIPMALEPFTLIGATGANAPAGMASLANQVPAGAMDPDRATPRSSHNLSSDLERGRGKRTLRASRSRTPCSLAIGR